MNAFQDRIVRAASLDVTLYEEVEADKDAMGQSIGVVILSSIAVGVGTIPRGGFGAILIGTIFALFGWYVWAYITHFVGTKFPPEPQTKADVGELLRTIGFSSSPGMIRVLGVIPGLTGVIFFGASIWMLIAMAIAVRQVLDYESIFRALGVCAIGWAVQWVILLLLFSLLGV